MQYTVSVRRVKLHGYDRYGEANEPGEVDESYTGQEEEQRESAMSLNECQSAMSLNKKGKSTVLLASFLGHYCTKLFFLSVASQLASA